MDSLSTSGNLFVPNYAQIIWLQLVHVCGICSKQCLHIYLVDSVCAVSVTLCLLSGSAFAFGAGGTANCTIWPSRE
jgi:hypothetical protein